MFSASSSSYMLLTRVSSNVMPPAFHAARPIMHHQRRLLVARFGTSAAAMAPSGSRSSSPVVPMSLGSPSSPLYRLRQSVLPSTLCCSSNLSTSTTSSTSSSPSESEEEELSAQKYYNLSQAALSGIYMKLEDVMEDSDRALEGDWEVEYSQGVVTFKAPPHGTYVLNQQPGNKEIWLSSPSSGPKRFSFLPSTGLWVCLKDGERTVLDELLNAEFSEILGEPIDVLAGTPDPDRLEEYYSGLDRQ